MSSTPPTRPRFAPGNRPRGNWSFKGFVVKSVWFAAIAFAVFYLMNTKS